MSILTDIYPIGSIIELYGSLDPNDFLDGLWYKDSSETILVGQDNNTFSSNLGTIIGADTATAGYPTHIHQNACRGITTTGNGGGLDFASTGDTVKIINNGSNRVYEYYGPGRYTASTVGGGGTHENRMRSLQVCRWIKIDPILPDDLDFIYVANDFDGTEIHNRILTTDVGSYIKNGTVTKNGSGASCFLTTTKATSDYLYTNLTADRLNAMKATNGTYTFFFRVINSTSGIGGIVVWRNNDDNNYVYMIRSNGSQFQLHFNSAVDLGATNFSIATDNVYKVSITGNNYIAKNLTTGYTWSTTNTTAKAMGSKMITFWAGAGSETALDRFYGLIGIARATTDAEDKKISSYLFKQGY